MIGCDGHRAGEGTTDVFVIHRVGAPVPKARAEPDGKSMAAPRSAITLPQKLFRFQQKSVMSARLSVLMFSSLDWSGSTAKKLQAPGNMAVG
jgi:hypothetical protein